MQANNAFPPLWGNFGNPAPPNGPNGNTGEWPLGWGVGILPFIEQAPLFNASNYSGGAFDGAMNQPTVSNAKIPTYVCPSESVRNGPWVASTWINYHASFGGPEPIQAWTGPFVPFLSDPNNIPGHSNVYPYGVSNVGPVDFASMTDGTSNTAMFSEKLVGLNGNVAVYTGNPASKRVSYTTSFNTDVDGNPGSMGTGGKTMAIAFLKVCQSIPSTQAPYYPTQWTGACWNGSHAGTLHFNAYNHYNTPNTLSCVAANSWGGPPGGFNDIITATSNHPGGVNVCFC